MKNKWYKTNWGVILLLFLFYPLGLFFTWKNTNWKPKVKWGLTAILIFLFFGYGMLATSKPAPTFDVTQSPTSAPNERPNPTQTPIPTKVPVKKVEAKKTPEQTFEDICKKYGGTNNCIYDKGTTGTWSVTQLIQAKENFMLFSTSKQISRDFIFAVYATKLPMAHASITITMQGKYYRAGLGSDVADTQPNSTWTNNEVGPSIFYDFLKSHTNGSAGDGLNSTYVETNLD